ncbi:HepT-like ribonuclease domain-containing protein [Nocardioides sp.]|uniref:HepT-like ribonuclease domain-containing protein n=1 Tax=Nocardioides sp. TaxID=35761 RepID=UPI00261B72FD|nr:HepT-like ribonuclease domain-containing protein [Nocardioides sp.]
MRREDLFLHEMLDAAAAIVDLVGDSTEDALRKDQMRRSAILWNFTVLGEAANRLPAHLREAFPDVEWRAATALRNRIVHGYWDIDPRVLADAAKNHLPAMIVHLRAVLLALEGQSPTGA